MTTQKGSDEAESARKCLLTRRKVSGSESSLRFGDSHLGKEPLRIRFRAPKFRNLHCFCHNPSRPSALHKRRIKVVVMIDNPCSVDG